MVSDTLDQPECSVSPGRNWKFSQVPQKAAPSGPKFIGGLPLGIENEGIQGLNPFTSRLEAPGSKRQVGGGAFTSRYVFAQIWWQRTRFQQQRRARNIQAISLYINCFLVKFPPNYQPQEFFNINSHARPGTRDRKTGFSFLTISLYDKTQWFYAYCLYAGYLAFCQSSATFNLLITFMPYTLDHKRGQMWTFRGGQTGLRAALLGAVSVLLLLFEVATCLYCAVFFFITLETFDGYLICRFVVSITACLPTLVAVFPRAGALPLSHSEPPVASPLPEQS